MSAPFDGAPNADGDAVDMTGIDLLPSGRFRFRVYVGSHVISGTSTTPADAKKMRDEVLRQILNGDLVAAEGLSLKNIGSRFLASRSGNRDTSNDEGRWYNHIEVARFASKPMSLVTRADARLWLEELRHRKTQFDPKQHGKRPPKPLSWQTRKHCVNLVRRAWEMHQFQRRAEKWLVAFSFSTGLRRGEQWCLHLTDVDVKSEEPHVIVRFGSWDPIKERFRPPKGRKGEKRSRRVPLWGPSLEAAREWLKILPKYASKNPRGLMFPTERGMLRERKTPRSWDAVAKKFGVVARIGRKPWWHLLRHTCASSMLSGGWGLRWGVEDVQKILGHQDVRTTQRYAHLAPAAVQETAERAHERWAADRHAP